MPLRSAIKLGQIRNPKLHEQERESGRLSPQWLAGRILIWALSHLGSDKQELHLAKASGSWCPISGQVTWKLSLKMMVRSTCQERKSSIHNRTSKLTESRCLSVRTPVTKLIKGSLEWFFMKRAKNIPKQCLSEQLKCHTLSHRTWNPSQGRKVLVLRGKKNCRECLLSQRLWLEPK